MDKALKLFLATPPEFAKQASLKGCPISLMAYRFGQGFHLYRTVLPNVKCALMDIDCRSFTAHGPHRLLINETISECIRRGFEGIILDLPECSPLMLDFCKSMVFAAISHGLKLYLPEHACYPNMGATVLISSFVTDISLETRLKSACNTFGTGNIALQIEQVRQEFSIPCQYGSRNNISALPKNADLKFSEELVTNYCSFSDGGKSRLILWDDEQTRAKKLALAKKLGIKEAFVYYPSIDS